MKLAGVGWCSYGGSSEHLSWWALAPPPTIKRGAAAVCRRCAGVADALITHTLVMYLLNCVQITS